MIRRYSGTPRLIIPMLAVLLAACEPRISEQVSIWDTGAGGRIHRTTRVIRCGEPADYREYLRRGWSTPEDDAVWASDWISRCRFNLTHHPPNRLEISARSLPNLPDSQVMTVDINGTTIARFSLSGTTHTYVAAVTDAPLHPGWNILSFKFSRLDRPAHLGLGNDNRRLAARISKITFCYDSVAEPVITRSPATMLEPGDEYILTGRFSSPVDLTVRLIPDQPGFPAECRVAVEQDPPAPGHSVCLWTSRDTEYRIIRAVTGGSPVQIRICNTGIRSMSLDGSVSVPLPSRHRLPEPEDLPDIMVVTILDACHAGMLGSYGNPEVYSPFLDRLAAGAVQHTNVTSTAAYTVTSVAGILTGELPETHGVINIGHRLNPGITTLAQELKTRGYTTIAFSAMPTVSANWDFHRGFDEFHELFNVLPAPVDGNAAAAFALDRINSMQPVPEKLCVYLHLREPHAPYHPPDIYRCLHGSPPSEYGTIEMLEKLDLQTLHPGKAEVVAARHLYQSQIAYADDVIRRWYRGLRQAFGPAREMLFTVASDHGEAFCQHGRLTHNSTVYPEMIHVPLLERFEGDGQHPRLQTASLSNRNILARRVRAPGISAGPLTQRTSGTDYYYRGILDWPWHLIHGGYYSTKELYNLSLDPGETRDLAAEYPVQIQYLLDQDDLFTAPAAREGSGMATPNPGLLEKLQSLGYLR